MTKQTKAAILEAIRDGRLKPSDLLHPKDYQIQYSDSEGYTMAGKPITENQYREFSKVHEADCSRRESLGLPVGYFITIQYTPAPFAVGKLVTLNLTD